MDRRLFLTLAGSVGVALHMGNSAIAETPAPLSGYADLFSIRARSLSGNYILGLGDSRTAQLNWQFLGNPNKPFGFVNMGIGGTTVRAYRNFLFDDEPKKDLGKPIGAILNLGINDAWTPVESEQWQSLEFDYAAIIEWARARSLWIVACTPVPLEKGYEAVDAVALTPKVDQICARLKAVCAQMKVPLIDLNTAFRREDHTALPATTLDGIHLGSQAASTQFGLVNQAISLLQGRELLSTKQ